MTTHNKYEGIVIPDVFIETLSVNADVKEHLKKVNHKRLLLLEQAEMFALIDNHVSDSLRSYLNNKSDSAYMALVVSVDIAHKASRIQGN